MLRFAMAALAAALVASSNGDARAGSVHSPFTKGQVEEARIRLYEHEMNLRNQDPTAFDHKDPVLGQVLASEAGFDKFLADRPFHHGLLCEHDPFIWRVVEGDILYHKLHPFTNPSPPSYGWPTPPVDAIPVGGPPGGGGQNPGGPGGTIHNASVPEPSSWALLAAGMVFTLLAVARRQLFLKLRAARRLTA